MVNVGRSGLVSSRQEALGPDTPPGDREKAFIALGSNLGDREAYLASAIKALQGVSAAPIRVSAVYETDAEGPGRQNDYLNLCVEIQPMVPPRSLLEMLKREEARLGRLQRGRWEAREIDIDMLLYGERVFLTRVLELPHPRLRERQFVLAPLADLAPDLAPSGALPTIAGQLAVVVARQGDQRIRRYQPTGDLMHAIS